MPKLDIDLDLVSDMVRSHESLQVRFFELKEELESSSVSLRELFEAEPALSAGMQIETRADDGDILRAKLQDSFTVERRPNAPQKSLDRVFERKASRYVKIERVPKPKTRLSVKAAGRKSRS